MKRKTRNIRRDVSPIGGEPARFGFYTRPVQKVVKRWKGKIADHLMEDYFVRVAQCVKGNRNSLELPFIIREFWPFIWEAGMALTSVIKKERPAKWLILLPISTMVGGENSSWGEIALEIKKSGGPLYETNALMQEAHRMKILTPSEIAAAYDEQKPKTARAYKAKMSFRSLTKTPPNLS